MADDKSLEETEKKRSTDSNAAGAVKEKRKGILSRIWNGIFRSHRDDFEKRLQYISKEEAAVLARMKSRSQSWRRMSRHFIIFSVILEVIAVGYAIMTTRSENLDWQARASRVFPMFMLPALSSAAYSLLRNINRMCERKDQKTLEKLRAERKAKIDELKEKTNYYTTQQLIQRYDTDPAAKAAAATVLASKLGADSGLKVVVGDESNLNATTGKSNDVEYMQSNGLRNRKQLHNTSTSGQSMPMNHADELAPHSAVPKAHDHLVVEHYHPQPSAGDGGWLARMAALLVGEDPTQSYALICGNCHMHNGLARKEDFPFITYYCPHCHALNKPKQSGEELSPSTSPNAILRRGASGEASISSKSPLSDRGNSPVESKSETGEVEEKVAKDVVS